MSELKMPEINYVVIAGNLTKDPVYRQTTNNTPVINFSIASNRKYKNGDNHWQEEVCYIGIVAWNRLAENCRDWLKKGSAVLVDGELQTRNWKSEEGFIRNIIEIKARKIQFLNKHSKLNGSEVGSENYSYEDEILSEEENFDFTEDSFDKFLSNEESDLLK